ncbi:MAG: serine hydrolase [Pseudonocardiaceae bacterium]
MKRLLVLVTVALLCVAGVGFASAAAPASNTGRSIAAWHITATTATTPVPSPPDPAAAAAKVRQAMHAVLPNTQVGFAVFDRQNNTVLASHDADRQFASMSVVKLLIALDVLASDNWATPDGMTQQQLHQMLADSDDGIASNLWSANGGPAIVTRMAGLLGLTGTQPPKNPGRWGNTLITPQDLVTVYRYITDELSHPTRDLLLGALADTPHIAADGFDQHFGIPHGMPDATWAVKQGWGTSGSTAVMNSTGLVGADLRYVVVMLVSAPANSYSRVPAAVTAGAGALAGSLGSAES